MEEKKPVHVVMFPFFAHGHISPFVELARSLQTHGLRISLVSFPVKTARIEKQLLKSHGIDLVELELPSVETLPQGVECAADLDDPDGDSSFVEAVDRWEKPFQMLLERLSPDFVIHDFPQYWTPRVASKLGIRVIYFSVVPAACINFHARRQVVEDLLVPPPGFPSSVIRHRLFELTQMRSVFSKSKEGISIADRITICVNESWAVVCNTCVELEGAYIEYWQKTSGCPVFPVGILMPPLPPRPADDPCLKWLDQQAPRSVVFVSFGSQCILRADEVGALVLGLQESLVPFLCVLRGNPAMPQISGERGLIVTQWAPQLHILSHRSTGAFLTQCGWNSVTEGLRFGLPLIALPMQFEQGLTAKFIAHEFKVGVEVQRNEEDGGFTKEDISMAVRAVMVEPEGKDMRANAEGIGEVLRKNDYQVHRSNVANFVSWLEEAAQNKVSI